MILQHGQKLFVKEGRNLVLTDTGQTVFRYADEIFGAPSRTGLFLRCARQGAPTWRWKSSTRPARGSVSRTARVSRVTANLEEAEGKALA